MREWKREKVRKGGEKKEGEGRRQRYGGRQRK